MGLISKTKQVLVVDVDALLKSRGIRGKAAPRQQLQALRALSRLAQREALGVTAVMSGNELEKAPHNRVVDGVRTRYAATGATMSSEMIKGLRQAGLRGVVVTDDLELEKKVAARGTDALRISTFRKLLDDGGDAGGSGGGSKNGGSEAKGGKDRGGNEPRQEKKRRSRRRKNKSPQQKPQQKKQADGAGGKGDSEEDAIRRMIDLVD